MEGIKLKPCPFCGSNSVGVKEGRCYADVTWCVKCNNCFARSHFELVNHPRMTVNGLDESTRYTEEQAKSKVAEYWNRRADNEQRETD